jgi:ferredoxin-NADP reductase
LTLEFEGQAHVRSYSLVGAPEPGVYRIAVKRLDQGRGGSKAMWQLRDGDSIRVSQPMQHFPLSLTAPEYLLIAGGIGVTPMVFMAELLSQRGANVAMVYGVRHESELAYSAKLTQQLGPRLALAVGASIAFDQLFFALAPGAQVYVCGPPAMLQAARQAWETTGRPVSDFRFETFGSGGLFAEQAFEVNLPRHKRVVRVPANTSLLDALNQAGVATLADCMRGECGLCVLDVLELDGQIDHRDVFLSDHEKRANTRICACVSRATGTITLDTAWRPD